MAVVTGARLTSTVAAGQRKIDVSDEILNLDPSESPYTVLLKRAQEGGNKMKTVNPMYQWAEDARENRYDAADAAGYASGVTTINVVTGTRFYPGALVKVPRTNETLKVTAVTTNALTVVRGYSGSTAAALLANEPLIVMNYSADENSRAPAVRSESPNFVTNYTQIFKKTVGASGTWRSSDNQTTPHDWDLQKKKAHVEHLIDLEYAALFGKPSEVAGTDGYNRTTGGLFHYLTLNATAVGGALTEAAFDAALATKGFAEGSDEKVLFASDTFIQAINGYQKSKLNSMQGQSEYGVNYTTYVTPFGKLAIVRHKLLRGATYGGAGVIVDFKSGGFKYRYLAGGVGGSRDTFVKMNRQETDRDGQIDELITEAGFQVGLPNSGATFSGITG